MRITEAIFTDKTKEGQPLISKKTNQPFFMLHLLTDTGIWISKYYANGDKNPIDKITIGKDYEISYKQNGIYYNLISIYEKDSDGNITVIL